MAGILKNKADKLKTLTAKAKSALFTGSYQTNKGQTALSSYQTKKQQETNRLANPFGIDVLDRKFQQTALELNDLRKKTGANYNPLEDAYNLTMEFAKDTLKSSALIGTKNKNPLAVADNSYQNALQQRKWDYEYSVLSPEQQKAALEGLGFQSPKNITKQNEINVINYAMQQGAGNEKAAALKPYIDAASNMTGVLNKARTTGWGSLTEPEKDAARQVLSTVSVGGVGYDSMAWDEMNDRQINNALSSLTGARGNAVDKMGKQLAAKMAQDAQLTYEDADKALKNSGAYQFAKAHPGDLGEYENLFSNLSGLAERVKTKGINSLNDKEQEVYYYAAGQMNDLEDISSGKLAGLGTQFASDLQNVNGLLSAYQPTEEQNYLLGMYRNTLEGAREWAEEAEGTKEEKKANDHLWLVEKKNKFAEYEQRPDFNANTPVNSEHLSDPVYASISGQNSNSLLGTLGQTIYQGTQDTAYMTPEERGKYRWYYDNVNPETAQEYYHYLSYELADRRKGLQAAGTRTAAQKSAGNALALEAYSVLANQAAGLLGIGDLYGQMLANAQGRLNAPINYNTRNQDLYNSVNTIRSETNDQIVQAMQNAGASDWLTDLTLKIKNGAEGAADSVVGGYIGSFFGASEEGAKLLTNLIVSSRSALDTMQDIHNRKGSDEQSALGGIAAGVAEWFFEQYSIEQMFADAKKFGKQGFRGWVNSAIKEGLVNAQQEGFTSLGNSIADTIIMGDLSEYVTDRNEYIRLGMSPEDADRKVKQDIAMKAGEEAIGGLIMGEFVAAGTGLTSSANTRSADKQTGSVLKKETLASMVDLAEQLGGEAGKVAEKIDAEKANNRQAGELTRTIFNQLSGKHRNILIDRMAVDLQDANISRSAAQNIALMMAGQELGPEQIQSLARDEKAMDVLITALGQKEGTPKQKQQKIMPAALGEENRLNGSEAEDFEPMPTWQRQAPERPNLNTQNRMEALDGDTLSTPAGQLSQGESQGERRNERPMLNTENRMEALEEAPGERTAAEEGLNGQTRENNRVQNESRETASQAREEALFENDLGNAPSAPAGQLSQGENQEKRQHGRVMEVTLNEEDGTITARMEDGTEQNLIDTDLTEEQQEIAKEAEGLPQDVQALMTRILLKPQKKTRAQQGETGTAGETETNQASVENRAKAFKKLYNMAALGQFEGKHRMWSLFAEFLEEEERQAAIRAGRKEYQRTKDANAQATRDVALRLKTEKGIYFRTLDGGDTTRGGVYLAKVTKDMSNGAVAQLQVIDKIADEYGFQVRVYDHMDDNGFYLGGSNVIHVALDAEEGMIGRASSHELFHYIKSTGGEAATKLQNYILNALKNTEGYDYEGRIAQIMDGYAEDEGQKLGREAAEEEMAAEGMLDVFDTEENLRGLFSEVQDKSLLEKIRDWLTNTARKIKDAMDRLAWNHPEVRALKDNYEYIKGKADLVKAALEEAQNNYLASQRGLYSEAAADPDVKAYQKAMENAFTDEDAQAERDTLAKNLFMRAEKGWIEQHADLYEDGLEKFKQALRDYGTGKVALNKALRDQGLEDAPADMNAALAYAGRQLENEGKIQNIHFSIKKNQDGINYVEVDTDQDIFAGKTADEMPSILQKYIKNRFMGKTIGTTNNRAYINSRSAGEYSHPAKSYDNQVYEAKLRTGTELDNMMDAAVFIEHTDADERHPEFPNGWDKYKAAIHVNNKWYIASISVGIDNRMRRRFYEANFKEMESTDTAFGSVRFITPPNSISASDNNISQNKGGVKIKSSKNGAAGQTGQGNRRYLSDEEESGIKFSRRADTDQRREDQALESVRDDPELYSQMMDGMQSLSALMTLQRLYRMTTAGEETAIKQGAFESRLSGIADGIIEKTGTKYGKRKLMAALRKVYTAMEQSGYNIGEVLQYTRSVTRDVLEASPGVLVEQDETTKEIIKELKNSKYYLSNDQKIEIRKAYGNVVNYIRKNYGRVGVAKKGADTKSLAEFWRETLTPLNPAVFAEDANGLDMPGILDAWLETANEKKYEGEYGANIGNYATDLALNAMLDFYDSSDTLKAVQDNRQEQIRQLTEMARNAVITAREEYEQRYLKRIAKAQERREATERKQTLRAKITRDVKAINALNVKQNDTSHVPEEMRAAALEAVRPFLAGSGVFTTGEMIRLSNTYNLLRERAGEIGGFDEDILATINGLSDRLNGRRLSELTGQELQDLSDIMGNIRKMIADANEAFVAGRKTTIDALSSQLKEDMREKKQVNTGKLASLARALQMRESTPVYFADRVGGVVQEMIGDFFQGQDTWAFTMDKAKKYMQQQLDKYHVKEWIDDGKHARFVTQHGDQIELNKEEALSLYALWKRETSNKLQNANHLRVGGFMYQKGTKYEGVDTLRPHPLTASDMHMIENYLTDEQKAFADEMVKYLSEDMSKIGNDVSMRLYGYEKFKEPYYFPYETDHRFLVGDLTQTGEQIKQPKSAGMTKQLMQNAATPITVGEFTTTWAKHINQMGLYAGFAESVDTMSRVLNHREAGEVMLDSVTGEEYVVSPESNWIELERAIGAEGVQYLKTLVRDISGGVRADERGPIAKGLSMFKKGSVLGNVSVVLQQPTAYARAMAVMSPQYLLSSNPARLAQDIRNMYKYSGVALIKQMGKFDTGTGKGAIEWMTEDVHKGNFGERALGAVDKIAGIGAEKADEWTWGLLWGAVEKETKHNRADLKAGSEEFYQAVAERFEDVVNHTQVYDSVLSRSEWMRSNTTMDKMVTSFMAEPTLTFNMLMDAMTSGENAGRGKRIARAAGTFAVNSLLVALAKSIATATRRKKDEGRTWLEKYVAEGAGNFLDEISPFGLISMIPWARDVVSIFEGYDVERSDMDAVTQIKKGFDTLTKYLNGGDISLEDTLQGTLGPIANLFGIPLKNLWRDTEAVVRNLFGGASANEPTTARDLKYSVLENLKMGPFSLYDSGNKAYYDRMEQALLSGDTAKYDELRGYLEETKQVKPGTIDNGIKNEIKGSVMGGLISDDRAISILQGSFGMTHDKAWETVEKWVQQAEHAEDEDYNYTKYGEIMDLVKDGQDISAAVKKLTDNTKTGENSIRSEIKSKIGEWYRDGELTKQQAEDRLKKYLNMTDPDELHWQFDEWEYMQKDTGDSYSRYVDVFDAVKNGKDLKAAMKEMTDNGYAEKDVRSKIKSQIGDWYKKGELTSAQAQQKLKTYAQITDANDLYWTMDQLDYEKANPKGQYKKYNAYYKAIETGTNLQKETKRYLEHGVDKSTLTRQITSNFKPQYLDLLAKGKKNEATALKARLLNAYEALGYDRGKKQKDIDKWTK